MAEQTTPGQGSGSAQGAETGESSTTTGTQQAQGAGTEEAFDKDRALATIRAQRESESTLKEQLRQSQAELKKLQDAKLSDSEKLQQRTADLEGENAALALRIQQREMQDAFSEAGKKVGARVPADVWKLVSLAEVEFDTEGRVKNADKLVGALKQHAPDHFLPASGAGRGDGGARPEPPGGTDKNAFLRRVLSG